LPISAVLANGEIAVHRGSLSDIPDCVPQLAGAGRLPEHADGTPCDSLDADRPNQRRLARAARAQQPGDSPLSNATGEVAEDLAPSPGHLGPVDLYRIHRVLNYGSRNEGGQGAVGLSQVAQAEPAQEGPALGGPLLAPGTRLGSSVQ